MSSYQYTAYGLNFESAFPLPELTPHRNGKPDITINYGEVPPALPFPSGNGLAWQSAPGKMLLTIRDVARYLIIENREIIIQPFPRVEEYSVRIFLLGSVLGALLHARRLLVLHSSVIQTRGGAALFMGRSGAGKSTLLGAFLKRGYAMMADDKAGIIVNSGGIAEAMPGFPYARLTNETVKALRYPVEGLQIVKGLGKYVVPVERFCGEPVKVHAAYSLNAYNQPDIRFEPLQAVEAFQTLNRSTYRRRFLHRAEQRRSHFEILGALSARARVTRVFRPDNASLIEELADLIEEDFSR